jgi:GntR family transcriptional regulator
MAVARYQEIRAALEAKIHSGELAPGARLPTETELQAEHGVSRATAQKALNELAQAGLVVRRRRTGTHVAEGGQQVNLFRYLDPTNNIGIGPPGRHAVLSAEVIPAGDAEVDLPGLDADEPVTQVVRLKYDPDEKPQAVEISAVPFALAPRLLHEDLEHQTIRAYFIRHDVPIARTRLYLDPVLLSQHHADLLGIEPGVAIHQERRQMWLANGDLAESAIYYSRPGLLELYVEFSV